MSTLKQHQKKRKDGKLKTRAMVRLGPTHYKEIESMARAGCKVKEICRYLSISEPTFYNMLKRDQQLATMFRRGKAWMQNKLRESLFKVATGIDPVSMEEVDKPNPQVLVHMSKAILGNTEVQKIQADIRSAVVNMSQADLIREANKILDGAGSDEADDYVKALAEEEGVELGELQDETVVDAEYTTVDD